MGNMNTLHRDLVWEFGKAKLQEPMGEKCWKCDSDVTVKEVYEDRCQSCGAHMSENPEDESPF
jgi:ferredoxin